MVISDQINVLIKSYIQPNQMMSKKMLNNFVFGKFKYFFTVVSMKNFKWTLHGLIFFLSLLQKQKVSYRKCCQKGFSVIVYA